MKLNQFAAVAGLVGSLMATSAMAAAVPGVYNSGVSATGTPLPSNGETDLHYTVDGGPAFTYSNAAYAQASDAGYIAAQPGGGYSSVDNVYSTTFDLTGFNSSSASLTGLASVDDTAEVLLNGHDLGSITEFHSLQTFGAAAGSGDFVSGLNTLTFDVHDVGIPPSSLEVSNLSVTADAISAAPEPGTWALMLGGVSAMGLMLRRRPTALTAA